MYIYVHLKLIILHYGNTCITYGDTRHEKVKLNAHQNKLEKVYKHVGYGRYSI